MPVPHKWSLAMNVVNVYAVSHCTIRAPSSCGDPGKLSPAITKPPYATPSIMKGSRETIVVVSCETLKAPREVGRGEAVREHVITRLKQSAKQRR
jgi:hypothetical protein